MRRSDREITELSDIISVMERCDVCRLAVCDGDVPYIVPMNFGMTVSDGKITLYFHSAAEGKKIDLIKALPRVAFEMDCSHNLVSDAGRGYCTMAYESVMGTGNIEFIDGEEKLAALQAIVDKYHPDGFVFARGAVPKTAVFGLSVESITGKRRVKERS